MRNFVQEGLTLPFTAPYDVASGGGVLVGSLFLVALQAVLSGGSGDGKPRGVFDLPKATGEAWTAGTSKLYWDNTNKRLTTTASTNMLVGVALQTQASGDTSGRAWIPGQIS